MHIECIPVPQTVESEGEKGLPQPETWRNHLTRITQFDKTKYYTPKFNMEPPKSGFPKGISFSKGLIFRFHVKLQGHISGKKKQTLPPNPIKLHIPRKKRQPGSSSRDLVWTHKWPLKGLSDLHLVNQKVTLKKLEHVVFFGAFRLPFWFSFPNSTRRHSNVSVQILNARFQVWLKPWYFFAKTWVWQKKCQSGPFK